MSTLDSDACCFGPSKGTKMSNKILGVIAGLVVWVTIVVVAGAIMRLSWPAYASVADAMTFSVPMLAARLCISAVATLAAGLVTASIAQRSTLARLMPGVLLLVAFVPVHITLWNRFPVWYHLTFLLSLVPLTYLGGTMWNRRQGSRAVHIASEMKAV
jgi:hypothetical protein